MSEVNHEERIKDTAVLQGGTTMLKACAACLDITPPLGTLMPGYFHERRATAVHDPLFVRALESNSGPSLD